MDLVAFLADIMLFGPLNPCTECDNGQLVFKGDAYYCTGNITEWTRCTHRTQDPARETFFSIRQEFKTDYDCLRNFKFKPNKRVYTKSLEEIEHDKSSVKNVDVRVNMPCYRLNFTSCGKLNRPNPQMKLIIERFGGKFSAEIGPATVAVISSTGKTHALIKSFLNNVKSYIQSRPD
jgi:hypothetical protein